MTNRLHALILMLSGESAGEVHNAARAITRELTKQGRDWHWLAGRLTATGAPAPPKPQPATPQPPPRPRPANAPSATAGWNNTGGGSAFPGWNSMIEALRIVKDRRGWLNEKEMMFIHDMIKRLSRYQGDSHMTPLQKRWAADIIERNKAEMQAELKGTGAI